MTPEFVEEALQTATTEQLIAELVGRPTWIGTVLSGEYKGGTRGIRRYRFKYSNHLTRERALRLTQLAIDKLFHGN